MAPEEGLLVLLYFVVWMALHFDPRLNKGMKEMYDEMDGLFSMSLIRTVMSLLLLLWPVLIFVIAVIRIQKVLKRKD